MKKPSSKKADSSADKTNRIIDAIRDMPDGSFMKPTPLKNKAGVHFTKLFDDMAKVRSYRDLPFEPIFSSPDKLEGIIKLEPSILAFKKDIKELKNKMNDMILILEELKGRKR